MKISLPKLPNIKFNKTLLLVAVPVIMLLALFALGAVESHRQATAKASHTASLEKQLRDSQTTVSRLTAAQKAADDKLTAEQLKNVQTCDWVRSIAPKYKLTVPPSCKL